MMSRCDGCAAVADSPTWVPGSRQLAEAQEGGHDQATSIQGNQVLMHITEHTFGAG